MERQRSPRRRLEAPTVAPSTITECARRYHACALALATSLGLPMTPAFLQEYHSAISCVYIEAGRAGVRHPSGVQLPPLAQANRQAEWSGDAPDHSGQADAGEFSLDANKNPSNGDTPPRSVVPTDVGLPCAGQAISALKPPALSMLISKVARLLQDEGERWVALLHALESERNTRMQAGKRPKPTLVEAHGDVSDVAPREGR